MDPSAPAGAGAGRLCLEDVYVIRSLHKEWGLSKAEIGRRFHVPRETIRDIINRKSWSHV